MNQWRAGSHLDQDDLAMHTFRPLFKPKPHDSSLKNELVGSADLITCSSQRGLTE